MTRGNWMLSIVFIFFLIVSAVFVVQVKYQSRVLFSEQQALVKEKDSIDVEWGRLQIELATWGAQERINKIAKDVLNMHVPSAGEIRVLRY